MNGYALGIQNGFSSPNDVRSMEDMNPIPEVEGGELHLTIGNMTKLKEDGAFANGFQSYCNAA